MKTVPAPPPEYFLDHYGECTAKPCRCLRDTWIGRGCPSWKPWGAKTHAEVAAAQEARR